MGESPAAAPCIFCDIVGRRAPAYLVYEDATTVAFLDLFPFTRGHLLVIPKRHGARHRPAVRGSDGADPTLDEMCSRAERLTADYNVALDAGAAAGQVVFHAHFHVIPRYGEPNPFHPRARTRIEEAEAKALVGELSAP